MEIQLKRIILSIILFGMFVPVFSQESNEKALHLTLKEAQDYAVQHNRTVWNAGLSVSEAQKKTWEAISSGLPQVSATVDYQNMMGFKMSFAGMTIPLEPTSNFQAKVTQLLFSAGYWVGIKMSKIGEQMSETARLQSELDIRQQTQSAYHAILIAEENRKILEKNLENIRTLSKSTEDMVRVGVAEQTDADQLKVQVATVMNGIKTVERHVELAYNLLRFQLGVETGAEITLAQTLETLIAERDTQEIMAAAFDLNNNYNVQLLDQQIDLANKQISLEKAASLPTVAVFYSYTYKIKKSTFDMSPNNVIGLNANIPIFASGQRHVRTQQARIKQETASNNRALLADQLLMQEKQLRFNLNNAIESLELQKEAMSVSQRVFESITRKFQQGTASSLDVTTANTSLLQAQTNYINAMMDVFTAQTNLEALLHTL
ncbi:MAG: TolC family protein [Bacteroidales bacterium]|jgi:outer membrane protein TolC|nr:TolC family protein [Bacteroidales bacterium]